LTDDADVRNIISNAGGGARPTSHVTKLPPPAKQNLRQLQTNDRTSYATQPLPSVGACTCHWWRSARSTSPTNEDSASK